MGITLSADQTRLLRLIAQRLHPTINRATGKPADVIGDIFAVQAQEIEAAFLSVRARSIDLTASQVGEARQQKRSIAWVWALRGTLHLLTARDACWLIPFLGQGFIVSDRRRMQQLGWDEIRILKGLQILQQGLEQHNVLDRPQVVRMLEENGLPHEGQAPIHLLFRAAMEGLLCIGPQQGKTHTYVPFASWLGEMENIPRPEALARLAHRYLQAYAPASVKDLAYWSGLKMAEARQAMDLIAGETVQVVAAGNEARMLTRQLSWLDEIQQTDRSPVVNLLPRFDTFLMGYADRILIVEIDYAKQVNAGGGIIHPVVLVDGRAAAIWKMTRRKKIIEITIHPFNHLPGDLTPYIESEIAAISHFLEEDVVLAVS